MPVVEAKHFFQVAEGTPLEDVEAGYIQYMVENVVCSRQELANTLGLD
ncbi:MAG: hypothetical protein HQL63_16015 [Magnetococcales bacterium]|nr:hypothetical protein [Magnetococcales bacterium]